MITRELINPTSIVVVGASNDIRKPGGKILKNLIDGGFKGRLYTSNPKEDLIQGIPSYRDLALMPQVDLAILAIPARFCPDAVKLLSKEKGARAFIIISAGFSEENEEGGKLEKELVGILNETGSCLIGPNCIGVINTSYNGCFTLPIPKLDPMGADFISASGATAVYVMEASIPNGITFSSVYSVGNSAQTGVEDILEYLDDNFDPGSSSRIKLLYLESINNPQKLYKHARSLIKKGCRIAAIKAGTSEAGSRAASSHTGALASPDSAVEALFKKAGIIRCHSREELAAMAGIFMCKELKGRNIAIITHAGGPAVMLTDTLEEGGMKVPQIDGTYAEELLSKLHPGSSVSNPIDVLATGSVEQISDCIDYVNNKFDEIDGMVIIFGSPGLFSVDSVYQLIDQKMREGGKPIFPVLPSIINAGEEIKNFLMKGRSNFPDEVVFGRALVKSMKMEKFDDEFLNHDIDLKTIRSIIEASADGYLNPEQVSGLLDAAGISRVEEYFCDTQKGLEEVLGGVSFPVVMKVVGPVHKSDVGGVLLNISSREEAIRAFEKLSMIDNSSGVLLQNQLEGLELFAGIKAENNFGHLILFGMGGIFIEVLKDFQTGMVPLSGGEIRGMLRELKSYPVLKGTRGGEGINLEEFEKLIGRLSALAQAAPEIVEMDLNPLLATSKNVIAVDARIRIKS